jgi:tetratricopeptide (TPR) repeat protein
MPIHECGVIGINMKRRYIFAAVAAVTFAVAGYAETPDPFTAHFNAGATHYEAERYAEAVTEFTRALELKKDDTASRWNRTRSYNRLKDYDKAIADCTEAIRLDPNDPYAYHSRGLTYYIGGDFIRARADWEKMLQLDPDNIIVRNNLEILEIWDAKEFGGTEK